MCVCEREIERERERERERAVDEWIDREGYNQKYLDCGYHFERSEVK